MANHEREEELKVRARPKQTRLPLLYRYLAPFLPPLAAEFRFRQLGRSRARANFEGRTPIG